MEHRPACDPSDATPSRPGQDLVFLGHHFDVDTQDAWRERFLTSSPTGFAYVVTPNVDHLVQIAKRPEIGPVYAAADWHICDSRILEKLARRKGLELHPYPGADLVRDLLHDTRSRNHTLSVIGPSKADFEILAARFPDHNLQHVEAPMMHPGSPEWEDVLCRVEDSEATLHLLCLSFPKQEVFARDLKTRGKARGIGFCVGASVDFLTDRQKRAPMWMRKSGLEWAYRLLTEPRRLWKRYLVDGPQIFAMYLKES